MKKNIILNLVMTIGLFSCAQQDMEKYQEKAGLEATQNANAEIEAQKKRAIEMEQDLSRLHNIYDALAGEYIGQFTAGTSKFNVLATFKPSIGRYLGVRIRTVAEIEEDIINLRLISRVNLSSGDVATGCMYSNIRPLYNQGQMTLLNDECNLSYDIAFKYLTDNKLNLDESAKVAELVLNGELKSIEHLYVSKKSVFLTEETAFILNKKN